MASVSEPRAGMDSVLSLVGLLIRQADRLALSESPGVNSRIALTRNRLPLLLDGFVRTSHWNEQWNERWQSYHNNYYSYARLALRLALTALPVEGWSLVQACRPG